LLNDKIIPAIPGKIKKEYRLVSLLSLHENALVFSLEKKKSSSKNTAYTVNPNPSNGVIKIMPKSYFDETLFTALQSLHHPLLLLPTELISEGDYVYALYPRLLPFSEYLSGERISLSTILQWIKDMSQIVPCLHDKNIFHGDIAPDNIYLDDDGHFYLGDFSSCKILSPRQSMTYQNKKKKTGTTFPFSSTKDCKQDIFCFLTILFNLLKASSSLEKEGNAILSALGKRTDNLLLELKEKKCCNLSFRQVCQNILGVIEENQKEMKSSHIDFILSSEKLDFLNETTKTLKKSPISFPFQPKISLTVFALTLCTLIFLSAVIYYAGIGSPQQKKSYLAKESVPKKIATNNLRSPSPFPTEDSATGNTASSNTPSADACTEIPPTTTAATDTPKTNNRNKSILDISCKKYRNIPYSPRADPSVKIIFAQGNRFKKISPFSGYPALEELYLDGNAISDLSNLSAFRHLAILGLSNNQITDLSSLGDIPSLRILDLSGHTKLLNFPSLGKLRNLECLILTGTNATDNDMQRLQQSLPRCTILH